MLGFKIEKNGIVPIYVQLAESIERRIEDGTLSPGEKLASEAKLCDEFEISRVTARLAIDELAKKGLVERKQGKGTYIRGALSHGPSELTRIFEAMFKNGENVASQLRAFQPGSPPPNILEMFKLPAGSQMMRLERLYTTGEKSLGFSEGWLPIELQKIPAETARKRASIDMLNDLGFKVSETKVNMTAFAATQNAASILDLRKGSPVLAIERTRVSISHDVIEYVHFTMNPELYRFSFSIQDTDTQF